MPNSEVNFISQGQLQKEKCALKIVLAEIKIRPGQVMVKLIENNLSILDIPNFQLSLSFFAEDNPEILKIWHSQLEHLGKQNILCLITLSEKINLSKSPLTDACPPWSPAKMHVESHKTKIEPG